MKEWEQELRAVLPPEQIRAGEPMAAHCSFRTGGPADLFVSVRTVRQLQETLALLRAGKVPYFILGRGSNLLVGDGGYRGVVISMTDAALTSETDTAKEAGAPYPSRAEKEAAEEAAAEDGVVCAEKESDGVPSLLGRLDAIRVEGNRILAGAGARLSRVAAAARDAGLGGLEFAAGIPGSVGGALVMNAGAYDGEMRQVVASAFLLMENGEIRAFSREEMHFGYRTSVLKECPAVAVQAEFVLTPMDPAVISERMEELAQRRRARQPLEYGSAGSTFKRPEGYFAGKLIMEAGLSGFCVGDAAVSEKHCGFVVNRGGASAAQIRQVIETVQERVRAHSGVALEREVIWLGES
ncbi:MAG: UDP-N-acetylmuramate dehydrogenase [Eubacteriales bacterium]|nr:UDP-N-acetylmuramate dehydrogenase [Eubacteriales bacterium]